MNSNDAPILFCTQKTLSVNNWRRSTRRSETFQSPESETKFQSDCPFSGYLNSLLSAHRRVIRHLSCFCAVNRLDSFIHFVRIPTCDGRTDGHRAIADSYRTSMGSRSRPVIVMERGRSPGDSVMTDWVTKGDCPR